MNIDYWILAAVLLLIILLIVWILIKNRRDRKKWEQELIQSDLKVEKHEDPKI